MSTAQIMNKKKSNGPIIEWFNQVCSGYGLEETELSSDLPTKWQRHGDIILFPNTAFTHDFWSDMKAPLWEDLARRLKVKRLGLMGKTLPNDFRQPTVRLLLGNDGWTENTDNHVVYCFDVTKTMFSSGNITEKMRVAEFDCHEEVVVDLYAGIGYYTLPYLVHAKAVHVHACEWNPDAVIALQKSLLRNKVSDRCTVHSGDNSQAPLHNLADRVNLGLLPTSKSGWTVACNALKPSGGYLHIHDCINTKKEGRRQAEENYIKQTIADISEILHSVKPSSEWQVRDTKLTLVKSYAPHIQHTVLDLHCLPVSEPQT